tara:strand:+ start:566 stop:1132 length:567 start_codon:yes stop_codon:yes gene_type:complete
MERRVLLEQELKDNNLSLLELDLPGLWAASFVERGSDATSTHLSSTCNTISIVAVLSCGVSTGILIVENRFLPSAIPGVIGLMGCLITVLICVLHENTIRQLYDDRSFIHFIVKHYKFLRLPIIVFSVSLHGIAMQIIMYTWGKSNQLGGVCTGITVLGCGGIHFLQRKYQNVLRNALKDANNRIKRL